MRYFTPFLLLIFMLPALAQTQQPDQKTSLHREQIFTRDKSATCLRCHSGEKMHAVKRSAHGNMDNESTPLASQGCEACHGPGSIHVSRAHGGVGFPKMIDFGRGSKYSSRDTQIEACLACHHEAKGGRLSIEWYNSPHNRKGFNCSRCHTIHAETDPMHDADQQVAVCTRCHRKDLKSHRRFEESNINFDSLSCGICHNVHEAFDKKARHEAAEQ